ncbi:MAG TPA: preprotein translocase subunit SecA, partial [Planctomycetaceae bacterium]|nr:preprotein translocase subunit SecA [Planctomycetaceae bacterium]
ALDDEILKVGFGPQTAERLASKGSAQEEEMNSYGTQFLKSQRKVERKHFRDRSILLHHEKERKKMQREMGQDPYLDTAD